jgi:hypothetical protein
MEVLRPIMSTASPPDREDANVSSYPLANMFEHLVVEETLEGASHGKAETKVSAPTRVSATVESTGAGRKQEAFAASTLLSRDVHRLRGAIQKIWKDYHEGNVGLVAASITTNTAIDFCRKLQEDFEKAFSGEEKCHERVCLYCSAMEDANMRQPDLLHRDGPCLAIVHRILERFVDDIKDDPPNELPTVPSAYTQPYLSDTQAAEEYGKSEDNFHCHYSLMMGILPELCALIRATTAHCEWLHAEHEIIRATRHLLSSKTQTLWVTFAFQVLLDIRHIMREDVTWAFDDLCQGSKLITSSIERVLVFNAEVKVTHFFPIHDQLLNQFSDSVRRWTEQDIVRMLIDSARVPGGASSTRDVPPYYLLKRDPLWCGMLLYSFRMVAHESAITMADSWSCILAVAHLYSCLRQADLLEYPWEDMEHVIAMHGADNLFVGAAPTTFPDCLKRFGIATGMRASEFAPNHHRKEANLSRFKRRHLKQLTPVSSLFSGRHCHGDGRTNLGPIDVVQVLRRNAVEEGAESYQIGPGTDLCNIIERLGLAIEHETAQMTFNHFEMHILCSKLLRQLHEVIGPNIMNWLEKYRDDRNLFGIVLAIFLEASKGRLEAFIDFSELMYSFVAQSGGLALSTRMLDAVAVSRRAIASGAGVVGHDGSCHSLVS